MHTTSGRSAWALAAVLLLSLAPRGGAELAESSPPTIPPFPIPFDPRLPPAVPLPDIRLSAPPIADRLLVKVSRSEIADPFRPEPPLSIRDLVGNELLPHELPIAGVRYVGATAEAVVAVRFSRTVSVRELQLALRRVNARLLTAVVGPVPSSFRAALIGLRRDTGSRWLAGVRPAFTRLKPESHLRHAFHEAGVLSMRRVFRVVEQPASDRPVYFRVGSFQKFLSLARRANPERAARAYRELTHTFEAPAEVPEARPPASTGLADSRPVRDRVTGDLRTGEGVPLVVPDNMENWFVLRLRPGVDVHVSKRRLELLTVLESVSYDYALRGAQVNDPEFSDQWGLKNDGTFQGDASGVPGFDVNVEPAWSATTPGQSVVVAVIDTGIKEDLNELSGRLWSNPGETGAGRETNGRDDDCNGYIDDVHGITTFDRYALDWGLGLPCTSEPGGGAVPFDPHATAVAGVVAAQTGNGIGIAGTAGADGVRLMNIAMGAFSGRLWPPGWTEFAEALGYAISPTFTEASFPIPAADIVNMSFSSENCGSLAYETVVAALHAGIILVASAGNDARRFTRSETLAVGLFPASFPGVITVGGATRQDRIWPASNYGPTIDLVAPSHQVRTTSYEPATPGQTQATIITAQGTSLATAFVSGGAAVVLGRHPGVTAPYMMYWLRAKARDMLDPLGDGSTHTGDDEWTGAGLLDVGNATNSLQPSDEPLEIGLAIERSYDWSMQRIGARGQWRPYAVGGSPDIGIRVKSASGKGVRSWSLAYGVGDAPQTWVDIPIPPSLSGGAIDYEFAAGGWEVQPGHQFLNTDTLANKQVYTLRLLAENQAGTKFTAYDWFVPLRASISFPENNWTMVPGRGWSPLAAFIDARSGATHTVELLDDSARVLWTTPDLGVPYQPYTAGAPLAATGGYRVLGPPGDPWPGEPQFPAPSPLLSEGWFTLRLTVRGPAGTDTDTLRFFVDDSNFPARYWNLLHEPVFDSSQQVNLQDVPLLPDDSVFQNLRVIEGSGTAPRLLVHAEKGSVQALDANGALVWEWRAEDDSWFQGYVGFFGMSLEVGDVDKDGQLEVLFASERLSRTRRQRVFLLKLVDGTPFNPSWPMELDNRGYASLAIADVTGDGREEIVVVRDRYVTSATPAAEVDEAGPRVRVLDFNGSFLFERNFPVELRSLEHVRTEDVDFDGKMDMLLVATGQILKGNNTFVAGWSTPGRYWSADFVALEAGGPPDIVLAGESGSVTLKSASGVARPGWPVAARVVAGWPSGPDQVMAAQVVPGGDEEVVIFGQTIRVLDRSGSPSPSVPEIDVNGSCRGLRLLDVDGDGVMEFVALVHRYTENPTPTTRIGSFLEAYELDGTPLAIRDARWPIPVPFAGFYAGAFPALMDRQVTFGDVDADGRKELLQLLFVRPWEYVGGAWTAPSLRVEISELN